MRAGSQESYLDDSSGIDGHEFDVATILGEQGAAGGESLLDPHSCLFEIL